MEAIDHKSEWYDEAEEAKVQFALRTATEEELRSELKRRVESHRKEEFKKILLTVVSGFDNRPLESSLHALAEAMIAQGFPFGTGEE